MVDVEISEDDVSGRYTHDFHPIAEPGGLAEEGVVVGDFQVFYTDYWTPERLMAVMRLSRPAKTSRLPSSPLMVIQAVGVPEGGMMISSGYWLRT